MKALGLDACRGKWLAVVLDERHFDDARLASDAAALVSAWPDAAAIGVDIPIGLPEMPLREADRAAGGSERRLALADAGIDLPDQPHPLDDVLDAAVVAWSAMRYAQGKALPLPQGHQARNGAIWR
jgi:predicted RNase H-like nuclease